jgi:beta-lactamase superfamily II metal-dependent hydrolase
VNPILVGSAIRVSAAGAAGTTVAQAPKPMEIYFIDVEGGQSTLIITPDRHSLLIDAGWAGDGSGFILGDPHRARDANRIVAAARDAAITRIDYLLITHFHSDHDGGVTELSKLLPIREFVDHGSPAADAMRTDSETKRAFEAYAAVRGTGRHLQPKPGDRLPLNDLEAIVVTSAGAVLAQSMSHSGEPNPVCRDHAEPPRDTLENPRSTGIVVRYGQFRFLDVGDLSGDPLFELACPKNLIGAVDVYLVAHHGGPDVADPATFAAFKPRVAIMNNGVKKGGALVTYQALHQIPGLEDVWQLHLSAAAGESNFAVKYVANLDETSSHWIKLVANSDGSFRVLNGRTGQWKDYAPRSP